MRRIPMFVRIWARCCHLPRGTWSRRGRNRRADSSRRCRAIPVVEPCRRRSRTGCRRRPSLSTLVAEPVTAATSSSLAPCVVAVGRRSRWRPPGVGPCRARPRHADLRVVGDLPGRCGPRRTVATSSTSNDCPPGPWTRRAATTTELLAELGCAATRCSAWVRRPGAGAGVEAVGRRRRCRWTGRGSRSSPTSRRAIERPGAPGERRDPGGAGRVAAGAGARTDDLIHVMLSEGVGSGTGRRGRLHGGSTGTVGELGHLRVVADGWAAGRREASRDRRRQTGAGSALAHTRGLSVRSRSSSTPRSRAIAGRSGCSPNAGHGVGAPAGV